MYKYKEQNDLFNEFIKTVAVGDYTMIRHMRMAWHEAAKKALQKTEQKTIAEIKKG